MVNTLVSIVMPLYNAERYVGRAIESVIAQTYPAWELIVVDDCSTDASVQVVRKYVDVDQRICLVQNPTPSGGPTFPRNKAIGLAKGRFIAFLDSDDIWLPTKLEEQLPLFADEDTWVVFSYYKKMDEDGHVHKRVVRSPARLDYNKLLKGNSIGNLTAIYDTQKAGKHYFLRVGHEDYVYWLHILRQGGYAVNTQKVHGIYRLLCGSVSSNKLKAILWNWRIYYDVEGLGILRALYCFSCYARFGLKKYLK